MMSRNTSFLVSVILLLAASVSVGCRTSEHIQATAPRPAVTPDADAAPPPPRTPLTVVLDLSEAAMPAGISQVRLRIPEIHFQHASGTWHSRRTQGATVRIGDEGGSARTLLATSMPHGSYEALRIPVDNVYVEFGKNAGAPVSVTPGMEDSLLFGFEISADAAVTLRLNFDMVQALQQEEDCRWRFTPAFRADTSIVSPIGIIEPS